MACPAPTVPDTVLVFPIFELAGGLGDEITYSCEDGYRLIGMQETSQTVQCTRFDRWENDPPRGCEGTTFNIRSCGH